MAVIERMASMVLKWQRVLTAFVLLMVISACSSPAPSPDQPALPEQPAADSGQMMSGETAKWPDSIPDDIPVLEGKIRLVMEAPGLHMRIFYEDMTKDQIDQYLHLLEEKGFHLEYQVYIREGFADNSEERLKKGDYDAVDITRGDYHMNIGYGEGEITYDIYTTGFAESLPTPAGLDWPADLVDVVPKPEECPIEAAFPDSSGSYQITCRPANDQAAGDYIQALQAAGYLLVQSSIVTASGVYGRGDLEIMVEQHSTALVLITIRRIDLSKTSWPAELTGIVPQPEGCPIQDVVALGGLNFLISCQGGGDQVVADYINRLISEGFVETNRMVTLGGDLVSVNFEKGTLKVQLSVSLSKDLSIRISDKP
jgi:hypothetical protein